MEPLNICNPAIVSVLEKGRSLCRPFFCCLLCCSMQAVAADQQKLFIDVSSFNVNESTSIYSLTGAWNEGVGDGDEAVSSGRILLGVKQDQYSLALIQRFDRYYRYSNATVDLLYTTENHQPLTPGKEYPLSIEAHNASSSGLMFEYHWQPNAYWTINPAISLLKPQTVQLGKLKGQAIATAAGDYDFSFISDMVYDSDPLYDRRVDGISGDGYSVDLKLSYDADSRWGIDLALNDILGELNIPDAPYTLAQASSDNKHYDENGYVVYDPVISGKEGYRDCVFEFKTQIHLNLKYRLDDINTLVFQHHDLGRFNYQQIDWMRNLQEAEISMQLLPLLKALGLSYRNQRFSAGVIADHLNYKKMKVFGFQLQYGYEF